MLKTLFSPCWRYHSIWQAHSCSPEFACEHLHTRTFGWFSCILFCWMNRFRWWVDDDKRSIRSHYAVSSCIRSCTEDNLSFLFCFQINPGPVFFRLPLSVVTLRFWRILQSQAIPATWVSRSKFDYIFTILGCSFVCTSNETQTTRRCLLWN